MVNRPCCPVHSVKLALSTCLGFVLITSCGSDAALEPPSRTNLEQPSAERPEATPPRDAAQPKAEEQASAQGPTASLEARSSEPGLDPQLSASSALSSQSGASALRGKTHRLRVRPNLSPELREAFRASLSQRLQRSTDGLLRHPMGSLGEAVSTRERFQHVVVQVRDENGNIGTECLETEGQLEALLRARGDQ